MSSTSHQHIHSSRIDYSTGTLDLNSVSVDPFTQFEGWMSFALSQNYIEPNAMTLSTVSSHNRPSSRIVLLRDHSPQGFVFYTNYESKKGMDLNSNPFAALNFFWPSLEKQIRIEGTVIKTPVQMSDDYFNSRPLESRIGAVASAQSTVINSRDVLEEKVKALSSTLGQIVPRPSHWGGYILKPDYFEFWQGRSSRLHDRICYQLQQNQWKIERLSP